MNKSEDHPKRIKKIYPYINKYEWKDRLSRTRKGLEKVRNKQQINLSQCFVVRPRYCNFLSKFPGSSEPSNLLIITDGKK